MLFIDDYYTTFNKPHVTLIDDPQGVEAITETGVRMASGACHDVDVLIYATGFDSNHIPFPVTGKGVSPSRTALAQMQKTTGK